MKIQTASSVLWVNNMEYMEYVIEIPLHYISFRTMYKLEFSINILIGDYKSHRSYRIHPPASTNIDTLFF